MSQISDLCQKFLASNLTQDPLTGEYISHGDIPSAYWQELCRKQLRGFVPVKYQPTGFLTLPPVATYQPTSTTLNMPPRTYWKNLSPFSLICIIHLFRYIIIFLSTRIENLYSLLIKFNAQ